MALTVFDGRTKSVNVAGFTTVVFMPAVAGFDTPTVTKAEIDAGTRADCDVTKIGIQADVKNNSTQFLCDRNATQFAGTTEYSMDDVVIQAGDPQNPDPFLKTLVPGSLHYVAIRRGLPSAAPFDDQTKLINELAHIEVTYNGYVEAEASDDGKKHERLIKVAVKGAQFDVPFSAA